MWVLAVGLWLEKNPGLAVQALVQARTLLVVPDEDGTAFSSNNRTTIAPAAVFFIPTRRMAINNVYRKKKREMIRKEELCQAVLKLCKEKAGIGEEETAAGPYSRLMDARDTSKWAEVMDTALLLVPFWSLSEVRPIGLLADLVDKMTGILKFCGGPAPIYPRIKAKVELLLSPDAPPIAGTPAPRTSPFLPTNQRRGQLQRQLFVVRTPVRTRSHTAAAAAAAAAALHAFH